MPVPVVPTLTLFLTRSAENCGDDWEPDFCWQGFCAHWALFDMIFANRTMDRDAPQTKPNKEWYLVEAVQTVPRPLRHVPISGPLSGQNSFLSERQYICSVLGSHYFEHEYSQGLTSKVFNGTHQAELIPDQVAGSDMWTVLLNFRPAVTQEEAESGGAALEAAEGLASELKEPVEMKVTLVEQNGSETWTGIVVSGEQYAGSNCVLRMRRPQTPGGYVMESRGLRAHFRFGHIGTPVDKLQKGVLQLMQTGSEMEDESKLGFWKRLVLAQDLSDSWLEENNRLSVKGHMVTRIRAVCTKRLLNSEQSAAIVHFFQHRVTIVVGPPGTGKSTLVAAINELLEEFRMAYWVCSDSNAAVDVLAEKLAKGKKDKQAEGFLRVWPAFSEGYKCDQSAVDVGLGWSDSGVKSDTDDTRILSLEQPIHRRLTALGNGRLGRQYWKEEGDQLRSFRSAHDQLASPPEEDKETDGGYEEYLEDLRTKFHDALRAPRMRSSWTSLRSGPRLALSAQSCLPPKTDWTAS